MSPADIMPIHQRAIRALKRRFLKGGRRPTRVFSGLTGGCWMLLDPHFDLQRKLGIYESETRRIVKRLVGPGSVVLDIGAGDGYEALGYARLGARVFALDPDPAMAARLRSNLEMNPELAASVTVVAEGFPSTNLPLRADFAKVDVDGGERGLLEHLLDVPAILVETHSQALEAACLAFLSDHGYETTVVPNARWRALYPEWRPLDHNRWLLAERRHGAGDAIGSDHMDTANADRYVADGMRTVEGWLPTTDADLFITLAAAQASVGVTGDVLEIGAYRGRSAILLGYLHANSERMVICDLFGAETDARNKAEIDEHYVGLAEQHFVENWRRFHADPPEIFSVPSQTLRDAASLGRTFRFIHVDGSHLYDHVLHDARLAAELLVPGGIVSFDDVLSPRDIAVTTAVWEVMFDGALTPVVVAGKLYAMHERGAVTLEVIRGAIARSPNLMSATQFARGDEIELVTSIRPIPLRSKLGNGLVPPALMRRLPAAIRSAITPP